MAENEINNYITAIKQAVGDNSEIVRAQSGLVNTVFLVDRRYVFRFPRDDTVFAQQVFERDVCVYLAKYADALPFGILKPADQAIDHCFVYEYIPGSILSEQAMRGLEHQLQQAFVQDLLVFINWLGETLRSAKYKEIEADSAGQPIEHWEEYLARTVGVFDDTRYPALIEICSELLAELPKHYPEGISAHADRVIHDDLHMGNLLFVDDRLSGVIDFGNIMIGDLECELRHFYRISPDFARRACELYESQYGQKADCDKVAWWARINDAATLTDKVIAGKIGSPSYVRALNNLAEWYPDKSWPTRE
jgi:aminoglycoside phosphotransferase (APT) family kinase protein